MYSQLQRFVATLLLFSVLLQSCGNPNWKVIEPVRAEVQPNKNTLQEPIPCSSTKTPNAISKIDAPIDKNVNLEHTTQRKETPPAPLPTEQPLAKIARKTTATSANATRQATQKPKKTRPSSSTSQHTAQLRTKSPTTDLHKHNPSQTVSNTARPATASINHIKKEDNNTPHPEKTIQENSALHQQEDSPNHGTPTYLIAKGAQVRFQKQADTWQAHVKDVWGREQMLPMVCAPDQTQEQAIAVLASKAPAQYKYCIHILETDQPPWAPKVVYVGALGLRGGDGGVRFGAVLKAMPGLHGA